MGKRWERSLAFGIGPFPLCGSKVEALGGGGLASFVALTVGGSIVK